MDDIVLRNDETLRLVFQLFTYRFFRWALGAVSLCGVFLMALGLVFLGQHVTLIVH